MNLNNSLPVPPGLRRCFWDAEYIAAQPFCKTSKLTDQQAQDLADFEEEKFFERLDALKISLSVDARKESCELLEELKKESVFDAVTRGLNMLDSITSNIGKDFFTKAHINRSDFLTR
jgi:hypothetical protein